MVQAAKISITGTQRMEGVEPETLGLVTEGSYCYEPGLAIVSYVESEMTGLEGVVTSFTVEDGRTVTLRRTGKLNAEMRFVRGQTHDSLYDMGFGAMMISVVTEDMTAQRARRRARPGIPRRGGARAVQPQPLPH